ncbi:MAG: exodeoxyribonuclease VII large subunit [Chthoniobacterales bacterium]
MQLDFEFQPEKFSSRERVDEPVEEELPPRGPHVFSVSELTSEVRCLIEDELGELWVEGEISNHRRQSSGHHYFTLKDEEAQLSCVLFAGTARRLPKLAFGDGKKIQAFGKMTVYQARGQYQMIVSLIRDAGEGELQARFEALKKKLAGEGLFDSERKKQLPGSPRRVAVITSPTGAALKDFLHVLWRRSPATEVFLFPVRVQGKGAAEEIARALKAVERLEENGIAAADVVVLTRGGGSLEDLWEFNDELLARAIAGSSLPVVSAVGHEIDFTISDFVADFRAPTPSAAAEVISTESMAVRERLRDSKRRLAQALRAFITLKRSRIEGVQRSAAWREPLRRLQEAMQHVDSARESMQWQVENRFEMQKKRVDHARGILRARHPGRQLRQAVENARGRLREIRGLTRQKMLSLQQEVQRQAAILSALSPQHTLDRGYSMVFDSSGGLVKSSLVAEKQAEVTIRFADGEVKAAPDSKSRTEKNDKD